MDSIKRNLSNKKFVKLGSIIYSVITLICYCVYIFLENYRVNKSDFWLSKSSLTQQDFKSIEQIGRWTTRVEFLFFVLFIFGFIVFRYLFPKKNKNLKFFLILNVSLFLLFLLIGFLFFSGSLPIGNITQPIILPSIVIIFMCIYLLWTRNKHKL